MSVCIDEERCIQVQHGARQRCSANVRPREAPVTRHHDSVHDAFRLQMILSRHPQMTAAETQRRLILYY